MNTELESTSEPFGFTWGRTDQVVWLRNDEDDYKRVDPALLETLRDLAEGRTALSELDTSKAEAIETLREEGYLSENADVEHIESPEDISLVPRLTSFLVAFAGLAAVVALRWDVAWPPPADPWINLWALPFFFVAAFLHELGHYAAARPYFTPKIRLGMLNRVIPAIITRTTEAWTCPRNIRIWISLAGPFVDVVLTLVLAVVHLVWFPSVEILSTLILVQFFRVLFVFNPLLEGDGYWLLVDATGAVNLRTRGLEDLKQFRSTASAAFSLGVILFTIVSLGIGAYVFSRMMGFGA